MRRGTMSDTIAHELTGKPNGHRERWLARIAVATCTVLLACGGSAARTETAAPPTGRVEGVYEYTANLPTQQVRGTMTFIRDTVMVIPQAEYCRLLTPSDLQAFRYTCQGSGNYDDFTITIDRRNPIQLSKWGVTYRIQKTRQVCVQYSTNSAGQRVCVKTETETYETTERRTGNLNLRKMQ